MSRLIRVSLVTMAAIGVAVVAAACGTERISVPGASQDRVLHEGADLFNQRCSGCHTLSYAATHGSAAFVRTKQFNNGPNFNVRCERPMTRVLYAIENGGFSGGIMPQNIVVGQQAVAVARFVATYAGRQAPKVPGAVICSSQSIGNPPPAVSPGSTTSSPGSTTSQP
jgi:mono/diheme cytochrome c family protein